MGMTTRDLAESLADAADDGVTGVLATTPHGSYVFEVTGTSTREGHVELYLQEVRRKTISSAVKEVEDTPLPDGVTQQEMDDLDARLEQVKVYESNSATKFSAVNGDKGYLVEVSHTYFVPLEACDSQAYRATHLALTKDVELR